MRRLDEVREAEVEVRLKLNLSPLSFLDAAAEGGLRRSRRQVGLDAAEGELLEDPIEATAPSAAAAPSGDCDDDDKCSSESLSSEDEEDEEDEDGMVLARRRKARKRVAVRVELTEEEIMMR